MQSDNFGRWAVTRNYGVSLAMAVVCLVLTVLLVVIIVLSFLLPMSGLNWWFTAIALFTSSVLTARYTGNTLWLRRQRPVTQDGLGDEDHT